MLGWDVHPHTWMPLPHHTMPCSHGSGAGPTAPSGTGGGPSCQFGQIPLFTSFAIFWQRLCVKGVTYYRWCPVGKRCCPLSCPWHGASINCPWAHCSCYGEQSRWIHRRGRLLSSGLKGLHHHPAVLVPCCQIFLSLDRSMTKMTTHISPHPRVEV